MLSRLLPRRRPDPVPAQLPFGRRLYVIGDIHGRADLLDQLLAQIESDDASRGNARTGIIFLGDLIDRGPDSAAVLEKVRTLCADRPDIRCLCGNHEEIFLAACDGDGDMLRLLLRAGGMETLLSYGLDPDAIDRASIPELVEMTVCAVPQSHIAFLRSLEDYIQEGDYAFVHAGIRPGIALDRQTARDLRWIRSPFLEHPRSHGMMVVHGHTITESVDERANRIGIDTGAYRNGRLTALGLEAGERWVLDTAGGNRSLSEI